MIVQPKDVIAQGLALLPDKMDSRAARVMLYAIGRQESRFEIRRQHGNGPATGFWQFERGGGVMGVLRHPASTQWALQLCRDRGIDPITSAVIWQALEHDDVLAAGFARLLLRADPTQLPEPVASAEQDGWDCYVRNWRPGKPHRETWGRFWREACEAFEPETV